MKRKGKKKPYIGLLKKWRFENSISQEEMGELLGVTQSAVSNYEAGTRLPNPEADKILKRLTKNEVSGALMKEHKEKFDQSNPPRRRPTARPASAA